MSAAAARRLLDDAYTARRVSGVRGPVFVVLCTETDDYTCARGEILVPRSHPPARYCFSAMYAEGRLREGIAYCVDSDDVVIAEML